MVPAVCGIDPGLKGGIAILHDGRLETWPTPTCDCGGGTILFGPGMAEILRRRSLALAVIEKVGARPGQGVVSMFNFGLGWGIWQGLLVGLSIPFLAPRPQEWKKHILAGTEKSKQSAIDWVKANHPGVSLRATPRSRTDHDGMAEAACLAEYGLRWLLKV